MVIPPHKSEQRHVTLDAMNKEQNPREFIAIQDEKSLISKDTLKQTFNDTPNKDLETP